MGQINILHLSDLHFAKSKESDIKIVKDALFDDLELLKNSEGISPDIVLFTGDMVQAGNDDEFTYTFDYFFKSLLSKLNLEKDFLIVSPGNHDIQTKEVDEIIESGLSLNLTDKKSLNKFLDENISKKYYFERLNNFDRFKKDIQSKYCTNSNELYSSYIIEIKGKKIGISNLNSSWRATGKPNDQDYGKLLIGERQVDSSFNDIKNSDIKIALAHHPTQSLSEFERLDIRRTLLSKFDYLFFGHTHEPSPELIENQNKTIISNGGCLYSSREYFNGYTYISIDLTTLKIRILVREYFDNRRVFDKALSYISNGERIYDLGDKLKTDYSILASSDILSLKQFYVATINKKLLTSANRSQAPKEIDEIFVKPPLSYEAEIQAVSKSEKTQFIDIDKLINERKNLLIIGKRESGKSTLIDYIGKKYFENSDPLKTKVPFQINYRNMSSGGNQILKEMHGFYIDANEKLDVTGLLKDGKCTILFDDFAFIGQKKFQMLSKFLEDNNKNTFIFAIDENFYQALNMEDIPDLGIDIEKIYLHSFSVNDARSLTKNWFKYDTIDIDSLLVKTLRTISKINLPRTPVILSIFLWILEKEEDFRPINKASLLERFIDLLLEKFSTSEIRYAKIDYRIKIHFLSHIAKLMVEKNNYVMTEFELEKETINYFESRGLKASVSELIIFFIKKGIFAKFDDLLFFKYKCFCEYFIAKQMMEDTAFYDEILKEENYLAYDEEINYLTGLDRNKKDLLEILSDRVQKSFQYYQIDIELNLFDKLTIDRSPLENQEKEKIKERLKECNLGEKQRDNVLDGLYPCASKDGRSIRKLKYNEYKACLLNNLVLYSKVIRNCELIDDKEIKKYHLNENITGWSKFILLTISLSRDTLSKTKIFDQKSGKVILDLSDPENQHILNWTVSIMVPLCVYNFIQESISTEKLENIISDCIGPQQPTIINFLLNFLYIDLQLPGYIDRIKLLIKDHAKKKYYLELIYQKLGLFFMVKPLERKEVDEIAELIADTYTRIRPITIDQKNKIIKDIKSERILLVEKKAL